MPEETAQHASVLETLARCDTDALKRFAETLLEDAGDVDVIENRTGLVMLPLRDTVKGTAFHLGEVLMSQARIRMLGMEGYGMRTGRDLEAVLAMAVVDAAWRAEHARGAIDDFLNEQAEAVTKADNNRLRDVEATRVNMETF